MDIFLRAINGQLVRERIGVAGRRRRLEAFGLDGPWVGVTAGVIGEGPGGAVEVVAVEDRPQGRIPPHRLRLSVEEAQRLGDSG